VLWIPAIRLFREDRQTQDGKASARVASCSGTARRFLGIASLIFGCVSTQPKESLPPQITNGSTTEAAPEPAAFNVRIDRTSHDRREAARYYRQLGLAVIPLFGPAEGNGNERGKRPRFRGFRGWTADQLTDELLDQHFGSGKTSNLGLVFHQPHIVVDLDSKHDLGDSVRQWLLTQLQLATVPRERTSCGCHLHFACPDLPSFRKRNGTPYAKALGSTVTPQVSAELFFEPLNVVISPSVHKSGIIYHWEVTGEIPRVSWDQLRQWFGFAEPSESASPKNGARQGQKWWREYAGDLRTLDIIALAKKLKIYGRKVSADENKHSVRCPWISDHSDAATWTPADTSSVIFAAKNGFPGFSCLHQQHGPKTLEDFLGWAESQAAGVVNRYCARERCFRPGQLGANGRPQVELPGVGRPSGTFAAEMAAIIRPHKRWFIRDDRTVESRLIEIGDGVKTFGFRELIAAEMCTAVEDFAETGVITIQRGSAVFRTTTMSESIGRLLLSSPQFKRCLHPIRRICEVQLPAFHNGKLTCMRLGYDERFRSFTPLDAPKLSKVRLDEAKKWIAQALVGFPWTAEQDLTHAIARLLTPFCRGLMGFSARPPLWFYEANRPRAGKDYLNGVAQILHHGYVFEDARLNSDGEEVRKRITTALIHGRNTMHFANCRGRIDLAALEQAVTNKIWADRRLGSNDEVKIANEIEFSLSANFGIRFTPDFEPRIRKIRLSYPDEDANSRVFPNPDLHGWVAANRSEGLSALGALVRHWYNEGRPPGATPFTSFPEWGRIVGGIMGAAGSGDPCLPHTGESALGDDLTAAMRQLFTLAYGEHPDTWIEKKQIYELIDLNQDDAFAFFGDLSERAEQTRFGRNLQSFVGRVLNGILLQQRVPAISARTDRATLNFSKPAMPPRDSGSAVHAAMFGQPCHPEPAQCGNHQNSGDIGDIGDKSEAVERAETQPRLKATATSEKRIETKAPASHRCRRSLSNTPAASRNNQRRAI
jgi:Bifunctional DNA primase/polymerase, N-terminal